MDICFRRSNRNKKAKWSVKYVVSILIKCSLLKDVGILRVLLVGTNKSKLTKIVFSAKLKLLM